MQSVNADKMRVVTLDAMRGFAVLGILAMNIVAFAMPEWAYVTPAAYGGDTLADQVAWFVSFVFVDGKMRGLFSLLFGASMMLIIERAEAKGENATKVHYSRMFWLALFGLAHYFLIWLGDILFLYAIAGSIAFLFRHWEPERLIGLALVICGVGILWWAIQFGGLQIMQMIATAPGADPALAKEYREIKQSGGFEFHIPSDLALYRGSYGEIVAAKLSEWREPIANLQRTIVETLPLMMIGMAMQKNGFLSGKWGRGDYRRWAIRCLVPGVLLSALLGWMLILSGHDVIASLASMFAWAGIPRLLMTVGYVALLIMAIERLSGTALIGRVAAAGQVAFTNYLGTSVLMTTIFYGYGLGLFGFVGRAELWLFVVGAWAIMLWWSKPWLSRFRYGPLEWLWRSLARLEFQPMRR